MVKLRTRQDIIIETQHWIPLKLSAGTNGFRVLDALRVQYGAPYFTISGFGDYIVNDQGKWFILNPSVVSFRDAGVAVHAKMTIGNLEPYGIG